MSTDLERRPLTAALKTQLETVQVGSPAANAKVGVGVMPLDSGWGTSDPNEPSHVFTPYFVIATQTATPAADTGSFADPQGDWHLPYVIQSYGVTHDQAEWMADKGRAAMAALLHEIFQLGPSKYKVQQLWQGSIGAVTRVPASDPPYYNQPDSVTFWMAKRRTP